jgi:hypothetical protein
MDEKSSRTHSNFTDYKIPNLKILNILIDSVEQIQIFFLKILNVCEFNFAGVCDNAKNSLISGPIFNQYKGNFTSEGGM